MFSMRILAALGALTLICTGATVAAQERSSPPRPGGQLPPGSYLQSCSTPTFDGVTLRARCRTASGATVPTLLVVATCRGGDIGNNNGYLACAGNTGPQPPRPPVPPQLPAGSYQQSCRGISLNGNLLRAQCPTRTGAPVSSSLDINSCRGRDIFNDNGYLRCAGNTGPVPPRPPQLPAGSYQQSCRGIELNGNVLRAQCPTRTGAPVTSSLDVNSCRNRDIYNDNGYLRCSGNAGPVPPTPPQGNFQAIGYTRTNYRGEQLVISGPIRDLADTRGFNDNIRSIRIIRGRAELCTDRQYRGRCVRVDRSYADLSAIGLSNSISSIR